VVGDPGRRARRRLGGERNDNVAAVYGVIGILIICIAAFFRFFTALGDAQRYVEERQAQEAAEAATAPEAAARA
jgi:hypothetical protein